MKDTDFEKIQKEVEEATTLDAAIAAYTEMLGVNSNGDARFTSMGGGRRTFMDGVKYHCVAHKPAVFKDSEGELHPYVELTFESSNGKVVTSIGFATKSVMTDDKTYEASIPFSGSPADLLRWLMEGNEITCDHGDCVTATRRYVTGGKGAIEIIPQNQRRKTWVYQFK